MSTPSWPATLPPPLAEGYERQLGTNQIRSQPDAGPAKVRRRGTASVDVVAVSLLCTAAQRDAFEAFYRETLKDGTLAFQWADPAGGGPRRYRFTDQKVAIRPRRAKWLVAFKLERLP